MIGNGATLYLEALLDLYSHFIVDWALSAVNDRHLALRALDMTVKRRAPAPGLLHHSDQGCTYASEDYRTRLEALGISCLMSRRGICYDNAVIESWFSTVKSEEGERFERGQGATIGSERYSWRSQLSMARYSHERVQLNRSRVAAIGEALLRRSQSTITQCAHHVSFAR